MGNIVDHIENVGGGGGAGNTTSVSLASNTFTVGQWIHNNSGSYGLANAGDLATAEPLYGVVSSAGDPIFSVTTEGPVTLTAHGFGIGKVLYLSETNGEITETVPTEIYKQVGFVVDANTIFVRIGDTIVIGAGAEFAFQEYSFTGDGSSVNFDLPVNVGSVESVLIVVGGVPQKSTAYNIVSDGSGNPRRVQFTEAVPDGVEIFVRYLGITKAITTITPVSSTDYNSGTPVPLALSSTTDVANIQANSVFVFTHNLGVKPKDVQVVFRCLDSDLNYSIGDELSMDSFTRTSYSAAAVLVNTTNIELYFDKLATGNIFGIDKSTNQSVNIDLSKWGVVVYANAEMGGTNGVIQAVNTPATEFESSVVQISSTSATQPVSATITESNFIFPHGLGQKPKSVRMMFECLSPEGNYSIGDQVEMEASTDVDRLYQLIVDNTNITIKWHTNSNFTFSLIDKNVGTTVINPDLSKWGIKVYANSELGGYKGDQGPAGTGKVAQVKKHERSDYFSVSATIPNDDTIPQNTEGEEIFSLNFIPKNPDSRLILEVDFGYLYGSFNMEWNLAVFKDNIVDAVAAHNLHDGAAYVSSGACKMEIPASSGTYKVRIGSNDGSALSINGTGGGRRFGGLLKSTFSITEILP